MSRQDLMPVNRIANEEIKESHSVGSLLFMFLYIGIYHIGVYTTHDNLWKIPSTAAE